MLIYWLSLGAGEKKKKNIKERKHEKTFLNKRIDAIYKESSVTLTYFIFIDHTD